MKYIAVAMLLVAASVNPAAAGEASPAETAWKALRAAATPPSPPREWFYKRPSQEELDTFNKMRAGKALEAADKARDYHRQFAGDQHAAEARLLEYDLLTAVVQLGDPSVTDRMTALGEVLMKDESIPEDERLAMMVGLAKQALQGAAQGDPSGALLKARDYFLKAYEMFPKRIEPAAYLLQLVDMMVPYDEVDAAHDILKRLVREGNDAEVRAVASEQIAKFERLGKPVDMAFTAIDGRKVDLAALKGKVVMINYWATWCGPCVASLPQLKASYEKFHPQGFELIGVSLDSSLPPLERMVKERELAWPQFYDQENERNRFAEKYDITSTPTVWLIDKKGNLRYLNGRADMETKIAKLMAEE